VTELRLDVPGLIDRPAVGTTCCAATAEAIIAQELTMLPGIEDVAVDVDTAKVSVTFDPAAVSQADIQSALEEVGYPGTVAVAVER
jgi:copper chaperone CopZ